MQFFAVLGLAALAAAQAQTPPYPTGSGYQTAIIGTGTGAPIPSTLVNPSSVATRSGGAVTTRSGAAATPSGPSGSNGAAQQSSTGGAPIMTAVPGVAALVGGAAYFLI